MTNPDTTSTPPPQGSTSTVGSGHGDDPATDGRRRPHSGGSRAHLPDEQERGGCEGDRPRRSPARPPGLRRRFDAPAARSLRWRDVAPCGGVIPSLPSLGPRCTPKLLVPVPRLSSS